MKNKEHRKWDVIIKIGGTLITISSLIIGARHFFNQEQIERRELAKSLELWEYRRDTYANVSGLIGILLTKAELKQEIGKEKELFLKNYYGELNLIDDSTLAKPLQAFRFALRDLTYEDENSVRALQYKGQKVILAFRASSKTYWKKVSK